MRSILVIIAVTGTPGTGKTSVSRELAGLLGYEYVDVNAFAGREGVETEYDEERGTTAVDVESLVATLQGEVGENAVLDGHLSHFFPVDLTVVLRCEPSELQGRLAGKGWNEEKIRENVEAEVLDLILHEAVKMRERVVEVDTTGRKPAEVAEEIVKAAKTGNVPEELLPGGVSWNAEKYLY